MRTKNKSANQNCSKNLWPRSASHVTSKQIEHQCITVHAVQELKCRERDILAHDELIRWAAYSRVTSCTQCCTTENLTQHHWSQHPSSLLLATLSMIRPKMRQYINHHLLKKIVYKSKTPQLFKELVITFGSHVTQTWLCVCLFCQSRLKSSMFAWLCVPCCVKEQAK